MGAMILQGTTAQTETLLPGPFNFTAQWKLESWDVVQPSKAVPDSLQNDPGPVAG
jgi:hypothetical protein